jgi:hypothetical protein
MPAPSDGRSFTSYTSSCQLNSTIQDQFKLKSESEYRMFLQQNPDQVNTFINVAHTEPFDYFNIQPCPTSTDGSVFSKPYL